MKKEILFFTSKTCNACKQLLPRLQEATDLPISIVDVEEKPNIASQYFISSCLRSLICQVVCIMIGLNL